MTTISKAECEFHLQVILQRLTKIVATGGSCRPINITTLQAAAVHVLQDVHLALQNSKPDVYVAGTGITAASPLLFAVKGKQNITANDVDIFGRIIFLMGVNFGLGLFDNNGMELLNLDSLTHNNLLTNLKNIYSAIFSNGEAVFVEKNREFSAIVSSNSPAFSNLINPSLSKAPVAYRVDVLDKDFESASSVTKVLTQHLQHQFKDKNELLTKYDCETPFARDFLLEGASSNKQKWAFGFREDGELNKLLQRKLSDFVLSYYNDHYVVNLQEILNNYKNYYKNLESSLMQNPKINWQAYKQQIIWFVLVNLNNLPQAINPEIDLVELISSPPIRAKFNEFAEALAIIPRPKITAPIEDFCQLSCVIS